MAARAWDLRDFGADFGNNDGGEAEQDIVGELCYTDV